MRGQSNVRWSGDERRSGAQPGRSKSSKLRSGYLRPSTITSSNQKKWTSFQERPVPGEGENERQRIPKLHSDRPFGRLTPFISSVPYILPRSSRPLTSCTLLHVSSSSLPTSNAVAAGERCCEGPGNQSPGQSSESVPPLRCITTIQRSNPPLSTSRSERPVQTGNASWLHEPLICFRPSRSRNGSRTARLCNRRRGQEVWFGTVLLPRWLPTTQSRMLVRVRLLRGTRPRRGLKETCCSSR